MNPVHKDERLSEATTTDLQRDGARIVRDAEYGQPTLITRHGKPVAKLVPLVCGLCGTVIRATVSGTNWVDAAGSDTCGSGDSHEPAVTA